MGRALTVKQKLFVEHYLQTKNAKESARLAGYDGNDRTLESVGSENLSKPEIKAAISRRLEPVVLSANQVLSRLTKIADCDIAEVFEADGSFNLAEAKRRGVSKLIKSLTFDKDTGKVTKVELYSAHEGQRDLGKYHKLFTDKVETSKTEDDPQAVGRIARIIARAAEKEGKTPHEVEYELQQTFSDKSEPDYNDTSDPFVNPSAWPSGCLLPKVEDRTGSEAS